MVTQSAPLEIIPANEIAIEIVDSNYLISVWAKARQSYLNHILNRKGREKPRIKTRNVYASALRQFFDGIYSDNPAIPPEERIIWPMIPPWETTTTLASQWFERLSQVGKSVRLNGVEVDRSGLSASTINVKLAALKTFFDYTRNKFEIPYNPQHDPYLQAGRLFLSEDNRNVLLWSPMWRNPFDPKVIERLTVSEIPVYPSADDVTAILGQIDTTELIGRRDYALLLTLFSTACRSDEVLNLKWGDLEQGAQGNYTFYFWGKSGRYEGVELQAAVYRIICDFLREAGRLDSMQSGDYIFAPIFPNRIDRLMPGNNLEANRPLSNDTANKLLKSYARRAGVSEDKAHLHGLRHARARHTIAEMIKKHGVPDVMAVNQLLRHSSLAVTQRYIEIIGGIPEDTWGQSAVEAVIGEKHGSQ